MAMFIYRVTLLIRSNKSTSLYMVAPSEWLALFCGILLVL